MWRMESRSTCASATAECVSGRSVRRGDRIFRDMAAGSGASGCGFGAVALSVVEDALDVERREERADGVHQEEHDELKNSGQ